MKKKELFVGVLIGSAITATGAFAVQYVATDNPFPITLNGNSVNIQGYNIEGSTYFKLRDIADVVGGFSVGFENNTITLAKDGYTPPQNEPQQNNSQEGIVSGTLDNKYDVAIMGARMDYTYRNEPVIVVQYKFTNNSNKTVDFIDATWIKVFQNRLECKSTGSLDYSDLMSNLTKDVQPGGTIYVEQAYELYDTSGDVTVQVKGWDDDNEENVIELTFDL